MIRCRSCCMPNTRPDTAFVDGECSACISFKRRPQVEWATREKELIRILETAPKNGSGYDCIVPSSGGKDSTWQVLKLIEIGARPLVVTATTCYLTEVGRKNIDNLARYATTVEITPNKTVRAKLNRLGLELVGDVSWPEHVAIFTTPFRAAVDFGIPLMFYGECPQEAYGGPIGTDTAMRLTKRWRSEFGGFLGLRPSDLIGTDGITDKDMRDYLLPDDEKMESVSAYFLGQFYPWDSHRNAWIARQHGMVQCVPTPANIWCGENLDCGLTGIHDFFSWLKYGFGRACAQASVDVRYGTLSRVEALRLVRQKDGLFPLHYMGVDLDDALDYMGLSADKFVEICNSHMRQDLFLSDTIGWGQQLTLREGQWDEKKRIYQDECSAA